MKLTINNRPFETDAPPDTPLLWLLRDELGLIGTRFGCGVGLCGACTVHLDGVAARSCITPLSTVEGKAVTTIEGLAEGYEGLHPVQQAFIDQQVPQCGYCMSGQIMAIAGLLAEEGAVDEATLAEKVTNLCRCGAYVRIRRAALQAAAEVTS